MFNLIVLFFILNQIKILKSLFIDSKLKNKIVKIKYEKLKNLKSNNFYLNFLIFTIIEKSRKEAFLKSYNFIKIIKIINENKIKLDKIKIIKEILKNILIFIVTGYTKITINTTITISESICQFF